MGHMSSVVLILCDDFEHAPALQTPGLLSDQFQSGLEFPKMGGAVLNTSC